MRQLKALMKFLGRWLGPAALLFALYLYAFPPGPFWDFSIYMALAAGAANSIAWVVMRSPDRGRHRKGLALCAIAALAFATWRYVDAKLGYHEEVVRFDNRGAHLVGTLYVPDRPGKIPGIVWVHGSGGNLRSSVANIAIHFAQSGYAVLVWDKRGTGESSGRFEEMNSTSPENIELLASDAAAALALLAKQPNVRADATGFVGVSQAGWVAPRAAIQNGKAAFMLLLSAPVHSTHAFLRYERFHIGAFDRPTILLARKAMGRGDIPYGMSADRAYEIAQRKVSLSLPYADYDPMPDLRVLNLPGLWLLGDRDWTVPPGPTARNLNLLRAQGRPFQYCYIPGASHGMYRAPSALVLRTMDRWLAWVTAKQTALGKGGNGAWKCN